MPSAPREYEVVSISLPRDLLKRANAVIPKARRSRVITDMLTSFLDSVSRKQLEKDYAEFYSQWSARDVQEERDLLAEWRLSDSDAWISSEKEESHGRR